MKLSAAADRISGRSGIIVSMLTMILFAVGTLPWTLDDYDQAKQAFISYQMIGQQRWLYQTTPSEGLATGTRRHSPYHISTKPPAVGWMSSLLFAITRSWDFAWRFPSFLAAGLLAALIFLAAERAFGRLASVCALAAFGLNILSVRLATLVRTDMPLALTTFAAALLMFEKIRTRGRSTIRDQFLLFGWLTAGLFIKGPIIYAFVLPPLVLYQLRRRWRPEFPSGWSGWIPWVASLGLFLGWVIGGIQFIPGFYEDVVLTEFAGRFHEGVHRSQPSLFYLPHLLQKFAPWSLLMIALCVFAWRKSKGATGRSFSKVSPEMFWLVSWALGGILVMSLVPSKRVDRIFPAIPPLCLLLAAQICGALKIGSARMLARRLANYALVFAAVYSAGYVAIRVINGYQTDRAALERFGREVRTIAAKEHLRYEVLPAPDEGLLLYLQRPRFWNRISQEIPSFDWDALVVPLDRYPWQEFGSQMRLTVEKRGEQPARYGFLAPPARK
jgi:4-amino-4-deoxy-L-arabinose transferase-like glycosyltransferase